ncbi:hypothetical protein [Dactylosporangium sp. NPDC048998]|uniref:hypothetical protein n=1 Tax=Dactylosporangium sp. NPDC048998 TaxID=3363976 RepID=UPI00371E3DB6
MTSPLDWHPAVRDILGMQDDVDPSRVSEKAWIGLDMSYWETRGWTENWESPGPGQTGAYPWNHWMPQGPGKDNWNEITLYRLRTEHLTSGAYQYHTTFQLIRAWVFFYLGAQGGDGKDSPSKQADLLITADQSIIDNIGNNQSLDPTMFNEVAQRFRQVWRYLVGDGQKQLNSVYKEIDDSGVAEGDAADAFSWAMRDMALGMTMLAANIEGTGQTTNWTYRLEDTAKAIVTFKKEMKAAWDAFVAYQHHNPNTLVDALLKSMERQVDAQPADLSGGDRFASWYFDFGDIFTKAANKRYDLIQQSEWTRLNSDLKNEWIQRWQKLDTDSRAATGNLITAYNDLLNVLSRGVIKLPHMPYPGLKPPDEKGPNEPPPSQGNSELPPPGTGGSNGELPPTDGSGSELPPPGTGGSNGELPPTGGSGSELPPPGTGGSNGELPPSEFGGSGGMTPPPNSLVAGTDFGGGPDSSGVDGSGGFNGPGLNGPGGLDGSGGVNGPGVNGPGLDGPGLGGSGSDIGGFIGAGRPGPGGAGVGSGGSGRPGGAGAGLDDGIESGAGIGANTPAPLDPNDLGSGGFKGLDPKGLGSGSGLTPQRPGGFSIGPLGTPPPGYTPSQLTNFPAAAVAGGAYASGGENIGGLPGAMAIPTPAPGGGLGAAGGMGGMPYMPPMGNPGGGKDNEKDRERNTWLTEDEEVWGTDPDVTAAVIGREDYEPEPATQPTRRPAQPRKPEPTYEPTRGRGNR